MKWLVGAVVLFAAACVVKAAASAGRTIWALTTGEDEEC